MSSLDFFLGIDLGTTSVKATLIDGRWSVVGQRRVEYRTVQIRPVWIEQDPREWWDATCRVVRELLSAAKADAGRIRAVSVSSQAPTLLGLDGDGKPTGNAMIWMDRRATDECKNILGAMGDAISGYSGNRVDPYYMLPKLLWEKRNRPERYWAARQYLQANGWIVYQLTHRYSIDKTHAALTQCYDIYRDRWAEDAMRELDLDVRKFPPVFGCMEIVGTVTPEAAEAAGLKSGLPVLAGAIDGATAPLGLKLFESDRAFEMSGQSSGIGIILDRPVFHPNLCLLKHAVDGKWILKGSMSTSGGSLKWFRDQIDDGAAGDAGAYGRYDEMVQKAPVCSDGLIFLPYLAGERAPLWDSDVKGVFFGLHLKTGKADMLRSIMEGTAFGLKTILEELRDAGLEVDGLFGTGGGYLSGVWAQIKADVLEKPIRARAGDVDTASLGSAYLARAAATGVSLDEIPETEAEKEYLPNPENRDAYRRYYGIFKELYRVNRDLFPKLSLADDEHG